MIPSRSNYGERKYSNNRFFIHSSTSNRTMKLKFIFWDFHDFVCKESTRKGWSPSRIARNRQSTWLIDFSIHSRYVDRPYWNLINRGKFQKNYDYCGHHWFCNNLRPILSQLCKIPDFWLNERIAAIFVNLRCRVDAGWSPNAKNYDSAWSEVNAWFCSMSCTILSQNSEISR